VKVIVSRFPSFYNLFNSLGNYAVTLDTRRAEKEEGEKEQTVDELRKCRRVLHVRAAASVITCALSPIESRANSGYKNHVSIIFAVKE